MRWPSRLSPVLWDEVTPKLSTVLWTVSSPHRGLVAGMLHRRRRTVITRDVRARPSSVSPHRSSDTVGLSVSSWRLSLSHGHCKETIQAADRQSSSSLVNIDLFIPCWPWESPSGFTVSVEETVSLVVKTRPFTFIISPSECVCTALWIVLISPIKLPSNSHTCE